MFEPGFSLGQRAVNFAYKVGSTKHWRCCIVGQIACRLVHRSNHQSQGFVFAFVGMCAGLAGTSISNGLLLLRQRLDPEYVTPNKPPNVLYNAATWSLHMGVSSNLRYQMLNGIDMVLQPVMPAPVFKVFTSLVRAGNNMLGGISFVMLAKLFGVQQSAPEEPPAPTKGGKKKSK